MWARELYKETLNNLENMVQHCTSGEQLEHVYKFLKKKFTNHGTAHDEVYQEDSASFRADRSTSCPKRDRSFTETPKKRNDKSPQDWREYHRLDQQIKRLVKRNKLEHLKKTLQILHKCKNSEKVSTAEKALKVVTGDQYSPPKIDPAQFTAYMVSQYENGYTPSLKPYSTDSGFAVNVKKAIKIAPTGKATGTDEIFVKAVKLDPDKISQIILAAWKKCSDLRCILKDWKTAILTPIFKKGNPSDPTNYRLIAVLSHVRKILEAGIAFTITDKYTFHACQLGFRSNTGVETAILRHLDEAPDVPLTAVLDLKAAYDSVPRDKLLSQVQQRTNHNTTNMVAMALQPIHAMTKGDDHMHMVIMSRGVPQGSPLSLTIINLYMDWYIEALTVSMKNTYGEINATRQLWSCVLFADDVKLQAKSHAMLQHMLTFSEKWAKEAGMNWNDSKCTVLGADLCQNMTDFKIGKRNYLNKEGSRIS